MLNNRELASVILIAALIVIVAAIPRSRRFVLPLISDVAKSFFRWPIIRIFGLFVVWTALWVWLVSLTGVWEPKLSKDTIILLFGVGLPMLFSSIRAKTGGEIFKQIRRETRTLSTLFLFYLNLESLPLWGELIAQPVIVFLAVMIAFTQHNQRYRRIVGCFSVPLALVGVGLVLWTTVQTIAKWDQLDGRELSLQ